jgi:L-amino acid N-acyltransferase YncA
MREARPLPEFRKRGVQSALLQTRLERQQQAGYEPGVACRTAKKAET